jgi:hypothetical protein
VGRRQQSLPLGRGEGEPRPGRHRRDHGKARRRSQASGRSFNEHTELPTGLGGGGPSKVSRKSKGSKAKKRSSRPVDKAAERKAALAYEREQRRRELERAKEEAARQKGA